MLLVLCCSILVSPIYAAACNTSPVFAFSKALYLEQYTIASGLLPSIERERSAEMAQFLQQVLLFKRAYERKQSPQQREALKAIDTLIASFSDSVGENEEEGQRLTRANIVLQAARLHLAADNVLRAVRLAQRGQNLLDEALRQNPDDVDALLSNGLYFYYSGQKDDVLSGLLRWWPLEGDKARGLEMMEQAVEHSADFAFEAARSLVSDVAWNRQDTCRYMPLFSEAGSLNTLSLSAAKPVISMALFCGQPEKALQEITAIERSGDSSSSAFTQQDDGWLLEAKLYSLAALGERKPLEELLLTFDRKANSIRYWQTLFSLAKAADVRGEYEASANLYRKLIVSDFDPRYTMLARVYLNSPYREPRNFEEKAGHGLSFSCDR
jgi:tetratricopeptide (TPR) repeat protein